MRTHIPERLSKARRCGRGPGGGRQVRPRCPGEAMAEARCWPVAVRESAHRARTNIKYGPSMGHGGAGDRGEVEHATEIRLRCATTGYGP